MMRWEKDLNATFFYGQSFMLASDYLSTELQENDLSSSPLSLKENNLDVISKYCSLSAVSWWFAFKLQVLVFF